MIRLRAFLEVIFHVILRGGIVLIGLYIFACTILWGLQKHVMFVPIQETTAAPKELMVDEVTFPSSDGTKLHGWFADNGGKYTILFFHGNAGNILYNSNRFSLFRKLGVNALMFDYRSYGQSAWSIESEEDFYRDAEGAYSFLLSRWISSNHIVLWGHSLGGAIAINTALGKNIKALVVESSFISMDEMAQFRCPYFPIQYLLQYHFQSIEKIPNIQVPILFFHSRDDQVIPFWQWEKLFENAKFPKTFIEIHGDHNHWLENSYETYQNGIQSLLSE